MIELDRHIEILLLDNDCVIIPGLGGFMTHHVEARYDEGECVFLPPLRTLGFNPQLKLNDSLLIQSYIEAYDISYPEAQRRIDAEVAELRQHIETEGRYELNDIGTLSLNSEGHLEFEPCEAGILTPSLYGLSSFEFNEQCTMNNVQGAAGNEQGAMNNEQGAMNNVQEAEDEGRGAEAKVKREGTITIKMSWLRGAVAVAAAVVLFLVMGTPLSNSTLSGDSAVQQGTLVPLPSTAKEAQPAEATVQDAAEAEATVEAEAAEEPAAEATPAEESAAIEPANQQMQGSDEGYTLVLASWVAKRGAETLIAQLGKEGFSEARLYQSTNMLRVVYGRYATETEAYNALRSLRAQSRHFAEAWTLKIEN